MSLKALGLEGKAIQAMSEEQCLGLSSVKVAFNQAREQLQRYSSSLQQRYGADLKLHLYAVVALGLQRLVFQEFSQG